MARIDLLVKMFHVTERGALSSMPIRDITVYAREEEKEGRKIIYLNIGDPARFDFDTPVHVT